MTGAAPGADSAESAGRAGVPGGIGAVTLVDADNAGRRRTLPGPATEAAVLVIDIQGSFADPSELTGLSAADRDALAAAVQAADRLVGIARAAGAAVVWVRLEQRPEAPWPVSHWFRERPRDEPGPCMAGTPGADWWVVEPRPGEPVVTKRRYSGFVETDLHAVLRSIGARWVVACGLTTECCVESTARDAFQLGYPVVVAEDACSAYAAELHAASLRSLALNFALVTSVDELDGAWGGGAPAGDEAIGPVMTTA